jgi:BirA family biotin operon repressor/biotin-[acetyl-CoA-carboxylase] ligase
LNGPAWHAPGFRLERHGSVGSTNSLAFDRARAGDKGQLWITAEAQTEGRGRRGRDWESPKGNLFASLLLIDPAPFKHVAELPLLAAIALAEAIDQAAGTHQLCRLKWPNDLLVGGAKLSGILLEAETVHDNRTAVVVGFGVNCACHPELGLYPSADLAGLGYRVSAEQMFQHLAERIAARLERWQSGKGFDEVRKAWLARAAHLGQKITVRIPDNEITGTFLDLDPQGHLVVGLDNGTVKTIFAGDVFLPGQIS